MARKQRVTIDNVANEMFKKTKKQLQSLKVNIPDNIRSLYSSGTSNLIPPFSEPKKTNRWILKFPKKFKIDEWVVKETTLPSHPNFGEINVKFWDPIANQTSKNLFKVLHGRNNFKVKIKLLDSVGATVETWVLRNCSLKQISFGDLNYTNDSPLTIDTIITYKLFELK